MSIPGYTAAATFRKSPSISSMRGLSGRGTIATSQVVDPGTGVDDVIDVTFPTATDSSKCVRPGCEQCFGNALDGKGLPIYGNYCGPQHGGTGDPIDAVDAACKRHDECYAQLGYFDCRCDQQLLEELPGAIAQTASSQATLCGSAIYTWFSLQPCACYTEVCYPTFGWCQGSFRYPCNFRTKWCRKWGVRYPCGIRYDWCTATFDYPCYKGVECSNVPYALGIGGVSPCSPGRLLPGGGFIARSIGSVAGAS